MLKKVFFEPERKLCLKLDSVRCSICEEGAPTKTVTCNMYKSGLMVCQACRKTDEESPEKKHEDVMTPKGELSMKTISRRDISCHKDLASGDHHHSSKCLNSKSKSESVNNIQSDKKRTCKRKSFSEEGINFKNKETTVKFLNDNFCDSESCFSCSNINENEIVKEDFKNNQCVCKENASSRPVRCPVAECHKILAQDSVLKHFYFDHSKIPRMTINYTESYQVLIQKSVSDKILCYAIFFVKKETSLSHTDSVALMNGEYKNSSFLLMGVRMPCAATEIIKKPHGSNSASVRHVQTQTDSVDTKSLKVDLKPIVIKHNDKGLETMYKNNDTIILWICKLGDNNYYYNISVTSVDKKLAFSVIGEAISIRECETSQAVNDHLGCLVIRGKAANKLVNEQDQLEICVSIFK